MTAPDPESLTRKTQQGDPMDLLAEATRVAANGGGVTSLQDGAFVAAEYRRVWRAIHNRDAAAAHAALDAVEHWGVDANHQVVVDTIRGLIPQRDTPADPV